MKKPAFCQKQISPSYHITEPDEKSLLFLEIQKREDLILTMFFGRVFPAMVIYYLNSRTNDIYLSYPNEKISLTKKKCSLQFQKT